MLRQNGLARECETKSAAWIFLVRMQPYQRLENLGQIFPLDADAVVANLDDALSPSRRATTSTRGISLLL